MKYLSFYSILYFIGLFPLESIAASKTRVKHHSRTKEKFTGKIEADPTAGRVICCRYRELGCKVGYNYPDNNYILQRANLRKLNALVSFQMS